MVCMDVWMYKFEVCGWVGVDVWMVFFFAFLIQYTFDLLSIGWLLIGQVYPFHDGSGRVSIYISQSLSRPLPRSFDTR